MALAERSPRRSKRSTPAYAVRRPTEEDLTRAGERLVEVMLLAEALPTRHTAELRFPPARSVSREIRDLRGR